MSQCRVRRFRVHPVATLSFPLARDTSNADSSNPSNGSIQSIQSIPIHPIHQIINSTPFSPETLIPVHTHTPSIHSPHSLHSPIYFRVPSHRQKTVSKLQKRESRIEIFLSASPTSPACSWRPRQLQNLIRVFQFEWLYVSGVQSRSIQGGC